MSPAYVVGSPVSIVVDKNSLLLRRADSSQIDPECVSQRPDILSLEPLLTSTEIPRPIQQTPFSEDSINDSASWCLHRINLSRPRQPQLHLSSPIFTMNHT